MKNLKNTSSSLIKDQDIFGHVVHLNYNNQGDSYKTIFGGMISIIVKVVMIFFCVKKMETMIFNEDDKLVSIISLS